MVSFQRVEKRMVSNVGPLWETEVEHLMSNAIFVSTLLVLNYISRQSTLTRNLSLDTGIQSL